MNKISLENQEYHLDRVREFYYNNKHNFTEILRQSLLDAIICMNFVIEQKKKKEQEDKIFTAIKNS